VLASPAVMKMQSFKCCGHRRPMWEGRDYSMYMDSTEADWWGVSIWGGGILRSSGAQGCFVEGRWEILHWG